jgi:MFS transporter, DHA1 family, multidrug resistance protein
MLFSPLSEIAMIGRNPPYIISFVLFFIVSILTAVVDNFTALMVLRFLQGFFGSPCLASGGASLQDIYSWSQVPYGFIVWVAAIYSGPALGPLLSGYAVSTNWRWPLWEIVIMSGPFMVLLIGFLPETSKSTILLHRAQRLRKATGNPNIRAASEIKKLKATEIVVDALIKPIEIAIKDPAIAFVCVYSALVYAIYYSFFESFPIVYAGIYHMTLGQIGLIFLSIIIGCLIAVAIYSSYLYYIFIPRSQKVPPTQESRLFAALIAVWILPVGLFVFAWTSRVDIHWIAPTIGVGIYAGGSFVIFQCIIAYIPLSYPDYVASLFAANDLIRSITAAGFVMFSRSMYINIGIGKGVSLLAGLSFIGILGMYFLFYFGATLRAKSRFAVS